MDDLQLSERVAGKILAARARTLGEQPFVFANAGWCTYAEANRRANRVANAFAAHDTVKGERVAILLHNRLEYLDLWFGLSKLGAIQVPISCDYKAAQIRQTLQRSRVSVVVAQGSLLGELRPALVDLPDAPEVWIIEDSGTTAARWPRSCAYHERLARASDQEPASVAAVSGADAGAIMNTSGTTGPSKGVVLSHAQQYILGRNIALDMALGPRDTYYNFFPLFHNTAQAMITLPSLLTGARMVLTERFSASRFWSEAAQHGCTAFYYIGEILRILLATTVNEEARDTQLRVGWGIGASPGDWTEFQTRFGIRLRTGYGSTEANVPCYLPHDGARRGSSGRTIAGFEVRIADEQGEPVASGVHGEILVRSKEPHALMLGYDADPAATVEAWRDLWLHTGDAGYLDDDGQLFFVGRLRDAIRVRGENISAFEIEEVFAKFDGVVEVAAIAVPAGLGGDDLKIVVVPRRDVQLAPQALIDWASSRLPRHCIPRYVEVVEALPKTPTNKIQKHLLRAAPFTANTWDRQHASVRPAPHTH
jgi:crotonobetaine/carnitine-CoA ligase